MKGGQCSRGYPKPTRAETSVNVNGCPEYKRPERNPSRTIKKGILGVENIVPYCPKLLDMFQCHINVEVCSSIKAIKYLRNYTHKGPDRACVGRIVDEVADVLDTRYCGASEAAWRIFQLPLHGRSHAVERLLVHELDDAVPDEPPSKKSKGSNEAYLQ